MGLAAPSLKGKALLWLAQREHSRAELQDKLLRYTSAGQRKALVGIDDPAGEAEPTTYGQTLEESQARTHITQVLDDLAAAGLQSDTRAAQSVARSKGSRYGVHRLKQQLQAKGLAPELVACTLSEARETEFDRALEIWRRRYGEPAQNLDQRARQVRFLTARGFDNDVVRRVVRGAADDE